MVSVKIISRQNGKPVRGVRVSIGFSGFTRGFTSDQYTDSEGEVHFNNDPGEGTVYINGTGHYKGVVSGMKVIYI